MMLMRRGHRAGPQAHRADGGPLLSADLFRTGPRALQASRPGPFRTPRFSVVNTHHVQLRFLTLPQRTVHQCGVRSCETVTAPQCRDVSVVPDGNPATLRTSHPSTPAPRPLATTELMAVDLPVWTFCVTEPVPSVAVRFLA